MAIAIAAPSRTDEPIQAHILAGKDVERIPYPSGFALRRALEQEGASVDADFVNSGEKIMTTPLARGTRAPDFTLQTAPGQTLSLREMRGHPAILCFYPADWSPVCGDQLVLYNELLPDFRRHDEASLVGLSVDGTWCHAAYVRERRLHFPLLSDFEPKGAVARDYGVYLSGEGVAARALFLLDAHGNVEWSYVAPLGVNPGADGILRALKSLTGSAALA